MRRILSICSSGLILLGLLGACADERISGSTTQTENTVFAREILVDSVLSEWNRPRWVPTVATLRFDSSNFDFAAADPAGLDLDVRTLQDDPVPFAVDGWDTKARIGRLHVRIDRELLLPGARFVVRRLNLPVRREDTLTLWVAIPDSQRLAIGSVQVDDFEDSNLTTQLPSNNSWYTAAPDSTVRLGPLQQVDAGGGRTGKALRLEYGAAASNQGKYALIGTFLGSKMAPRSLRSLDSLVVWVKGSGNLSVAFDRLPPHDKAKAWAHTTLDSTWRRLRIRPQDFDPPDGIANNRGWEAVRDSVTNLTFLVSDGATLFLDDVRFFGVDRDDLK